MKRLLAVLLGAMMFSSTVFAFSGLGDDYADVEAFLVIGLSYWAQDDLGYFPGIMRDKLSSVLRERLESGRRRVSREELPFWVLSLALINRLREQGHCQWDNGALEMWGDRINGSIGRDAVDMWASADRINGNIGDNNIDIWLSADRINGRIGDDGIDLWVSSDRINGDIRGISIDIWTSDDRNHGSINNNGVDIHVSDDRISGSAGNKYIDMYR